jgi:hypothetical protein
LKEAVGTQILLGFISRNRVEVTGHDSLKSEWGTLGGSLVRQQIYRTSEAVRTLSFDVALKRNTSYDLPLFHFGQCIWREVQILQPFKKYQWDKLATGNIQNF